MNLKNLFSIGLIALALSCKKEKEAEQTPAPSTVVKDCETNNYGIVKVDFSSNLLAHSIILTYPDQTFREKIIPIGTISDTIHIKTGSFTLSFASLNTLGLALEQSTTSNSIAKCQEMTIGVSF